MLELESVNNKDAITASAVSILKFCLIRKYYQNKIIISEIKQLVSNKPSYSISKKHIAGLKGLLGSLSK